MSSNVRCERKDKRRNFERVLEAARELLTTRGPQVTMEEIAQAAGVGVGTIYRRFATKQALVAAISDLACAEARREVYACASTSDPLARLRGLLLALHQQGCEESHLLVLTDQVASGSRALGSELRELIAAAIADGQARGQLRRGAPDLLAAICIALIDPALLRQLSVSSAAPADEIAQTIAEILLAGLRTPEPVR